MVRQREVRATSGSIQHSICDRRTGGDAEHSTQQVEAELVKKLESVYVQNLPPTVDDQTAGPVPPQ